MNEDQVREIILERVNDELDMVKFHMFDLTLIGDRCTSYLHNPCHHTEIRRETIRTAPTIGENSM